MRLRLLATGSLMLMGAGLAFLLTATVIEAAATASPHGGNGSGVPYYNGQVQSDNYTYAVDERDSGIARWHTATGRRYIDQFVAGEAMRQYVVYSESQQDIDLANYLSAPSCKSFTDTDTKYSNVAAFEFGHHVLNGDSQFTVVCLNTAALVGGTNPWETRALETRRKGMTHEMGHSIHLAHDNDGAMDTCWCRDISTGSNGEAPLVNSIYAAPH